jgi:nicotinate-nucleotide adenylyltransferase
LNLKVSNLLKLGIMGGTFDPIHLGHIKVAEIVRTQFSLENVIFVPARCPPHKSINDITPAEHRYAMVELAIKDIPYFQPSPIEMERSCPSYAGDTIKALKEKYGDNWQIYFITGLDALLTIINWDRSRTNEIAKRIQSEFVPYITIIEEPRLSISSTAIRSRVRAHQSIDEMVPEDVRNYIITRGLYQGKKFIIE